MRYVNTVSNLFNGVRRQVRNSICFKFSNEFEIDKASRYTGNIHTTTGLENNCKAPYFDPAKQKFDR